MMEYGKYGKSRRFSRKVENFTCKVCKAKVTGPGYTDHCPNCLWGRHVDINPGDRKSTCRALMRPVRTEYTRRGFVIVYVCEKCHERKRIGAAADDNNDLLFSLIGR